MRLRSPVPKSPTVLSDGEWAAMQRVWARSASAAGREQAAERAPEAPAGTREGVTAREVFEELRRERGWAYTTVKTVLDRLVEKGVLAVRLDAHVSRYAPLITEAEARRSAVRALVDRAFDGAFGPLLHMLAGEERLSAKDRAALRLLLEERKDPSPGGRS